MKYISILALLFLLTLRADGQARDRTNSNMKLLPFLMNNLGSENSMLYMMAMRSPQMMQYMLPLAAGSGNDNLTRLLTMMLSTGGLKATAAVGGTAKGRRAF